VIGSCEHCGASFEVKLIHNSFNDSSYAYCGDCGRTAILFAYSKRWPDSVKWTHAEIANEMEPYLLPCQCGGKFSKGSSPRCPKCRQVLSADKATGYIEAQSPGATKGWRWQRDCHGVYGVVVDGRIVHDNFVEP
jgi:hypothetical protein